MAARIAAAWVRNAEIMENLATPMHNVPENAVEMVVSKKEDRTVGTIVARASLRRLKITSATPKSKMAARIAAAWVRNAEIMDNLATPMHNVPENAVEMGVSKKEDRTVGTIVARASLRRWKITSA